MGFVWATPPQGMTTAPIVWLDDAVACFRACLEYNPNHFASHWSLGFVLLDQQNPDEAAAFRKATALNPNHAYTRYGLGRVLMQLGEQPEEAIAEFRQAIELDPKQADAHYQLGKLLRRQNETEEPLACFHKTIELNPQHAAAHYQLGVLLRELNQLDEALAYFQKTIELNPQHAAAHGHFGSLLAIQGKAIEGMAAMRKALELNPKLAGSHSELAWYLATAADSTLRDPAAAVSHARTATELQPGQPDHWRNLGVTLLRNEDNKAAVEALEKFEGMTSGKIHSHRFFLAMAYWRLGEEDKARRAWQAVEWMDREHPANTEQIRFRAEAAELLEINGDAAPPDAK